jgi:CIC family chloride channel protein
MRPQQFVPSRILDLWQPEGWHFSAAAAMAIGAGAAIGVWLFKQLITLFQGLFAGFAASLSAFGPPAVILMPVAGGLIVGLIVHFWVGEERIHGVAGIIASVALAGGRLRYRRAPAKVLGSSISIGSGAAVGPEDPSVAAFWEACLLPRCLLGRA